MNRIGIVRHPVDVSAVVGEAVEIRTKGCNLTVENSPDDTSEGCPLIKFNSEEGDGVPAMSRATYRTAGFERFYVISQGTAGTLYVLTYGKDLAVELPYHP